MSTMGIGVGHLAIRYLNANLTPGRPCTRRKARPWVLESFWQHRARTDNPVSGHWSPILRRCCCSGQRRWPARQGCVAFHHEHVRDCAAGRAKVTRSIKFAVHNWSGFIEAFFWGPETRSFLRATFRDTPMLLALMHGAVACRGAYARILDGYRFTAEQVRNDLIFVATDGQTVLDFYSLANFDSEPELDLLFVADAAQGTGFGALLFGHMRALAPGRGIGNIKIVSHPPAEGFYARMGARKVAVQPPSGRVAWERPILVLETGAALGDPSGMPPLGATRSGRSHTEGS